MMHTYLRTIGFSELKNRAEVEKLLSKVVKEATERRILKKELLNDSHRTSPYKHLYLLVC